MIIKSVNMRIPIVISRSGFTASGVELARRANLTLIGRAKGKRFTVLSGEKELDKMKIGGIILSGGKSRRMKSDKSLKKINNRTLLEIVIEKSMKQLDYIFINSNNLENYDFKGKKIDVVKDCIKGYLGPLAGILTGMKWLKNKNNNFTHLMSFPIDSPFFPNNLVSKFLVHKDKYEIISANSGDRNHPVFSLWHLKLEEELEIS